MFNKEGEKMKQKNLSLKVEAKADNKENIISKLRFVIRQLEWGCFQCVDDEDLFWNMEEHKK